ncbi:MULTISPECIES: type II toxin-antitoxin system RelE/ParE family toxin [unclassified Sphingomonas]|uniref:type II toxin-antitoxin system RelE/ParE family toxin n=1 Tax=unclassified Sphingomonas TaxID=196159 RepID=UPI0008312DCA|nr:MULTISPECIES: type II toxin-antitoxin system RelE/ParE family toxin [unclassified Sphingomonas]
MRQLIWSFPARRDLYRIAAAYSEMDPTLPLEILMRIEQTPYALLDYPDIGSPTPRKGIRKWYVRKTPLMLFYASTRARLEIRRVVHERSDRFGLEP